MIDFLVIGGGVAGVSAGARLSHLGQVVLVEAEPALGYHASGRSAALYEAQYGLPSTIDLNIASGAYHRTANGGYLTDRGFLLIAGAHEKAAFDKDAKDLHAKEIAVAEACKMVPILDRDALSWAAFHAEAYDIDTDRLIQDFARDIRAQAGAVHMGQRVERIERLSPGWRVWTDTSAFECRTLVNAAGAWADRVAEMAGIAPIGLTPLRRSMARIAAPGGYDVSAWPMIFGPGETWYAKPDAGALLVSPADEDPCPPQDAWADDLVLAEGLARYQDYVTEPVTRPIATWAGLRTFSPDRALILGPDPGTPSFVWCAGQGGYGFQTAPAASQLLADLVAGRNNELPAHTISALRPDRLR